MLSNPLNTDPFRIVFRFCGVAAVFYGVWVWWFDAFKSNAAFALYQHASPGWLAGPLIIGGLTQFIGCWVYNKWAAMIGAGMGATVFLAIFISCLQYQTKGTGVAAYLIITVLYLILIHCTIRLPLPCSTHDCRA